MTTDTLIPLESKPEVMNKFLQNLGVSSQWGLVDVMGLEPEMLSSWVPRPVLAVLLLFPVSDANEQHKQQEEKEILSKGQAVSNYIFYVKQNISNACGTIALVHSVANNIDMIELTDGHMKKFLEEGQGFRCCSSGYSNEKCEGIIITHKELAQEGQTNTSSAEEPVNHHFIAFVHKDGALYEWDGRKAFPVNHGATTADTLLEDAAKIYKEFMARGPSEVCFTVVALSAAD